MTNRTELYIADDEQEIPLHMFRSHPDPTPDAIPFMYFEFSDAVPGSLVSYPHRHNFYEILYVTGGKGTHFVDFNAYPIEPNTFYFISPGQVHYWETDGQPIEGDILIFTEDFLLLAPTDYMVLHEFSFFHTVEESPILHVEETDYARVAPLLQAIGAEFAGREFRSESALRAYMHVLLVQIQRICAQREPQTLNGQEKANQKLTRQFKQLASSQFLTEQSVQAYADQLGVTMSHLNNIVKSVTGQTPGRLIRQETVIEAKRLFAHTQMTAAEVGHRLGFTDPSYFSRFFQREVGMSTMQFRHNIADN